MAEVTFYPEVRCEVSPGGLLPGGVTAIVKDVNGRRQFVQVTPGMINRRGGQNYLPVGIVEIDRKGRRVLIELPAEADSGANRVRVGFSDLWGETARGAGSSRDPRGVRNDS